MLKPFLQMNFVVDMGLGTDTEGLAGFQECNGLGTELSVIEYRPGSYKDNNVQKLNGLSKQTDVTLKRGYMGTTKVFELLEQIRKGDKAAIRDMTVTLQDQEHKAVVTWTLHDARVTKVTYGPLNGKGTDVAMEELVIAYQRLEMKLGS